MGHYDRRPIVVPPTNRFCPFIINLLKKNLYRQIFFKKIMYFFVAFMCFLHHIVLYVAPNVSGFGGKRQYTWRQRSGSLGANVSTRGAKCQGVWGQTSVHLAPKVREFGGKRQYTWRQMSGSLGANVSTLGTKRQGVWGQTSRHLAANVREFRGKRQYTWRQMSGSLGVNVSTLGQVLANTLYFLQILFFIAGMMCFYVNCHITVPGIVWHTYTNVI